MNPITEQGAENKLEQLQFAGPLYSQVAAHLRARMSAGEWALRQPLPNESDLATQYRVSLGTMRKALEVLTRKNLLSRQQGRGTFVNPSAFTTDSTYWPLSLIGDRVTTVAHGVRTTIDVRGSETLKAGHDDAALLNVPSGTPLICISLLTNDAPTASSLDRLLVKRPSAPKFDELPAGENELLRLIFELLRTVVKCTDQIRPALADESDKALGVAKGNPMLSVQRIAFDASDRVVLAIDRRVIVHSKAKYLLTLQ